jgi:hypothetical protein
MVKKVKQFFAVPRRSPTVEEHLIALHEAAHVVVALVFGIDTAYVEMKRRSGFTMTLNNDFFDGATEMLEAERLARIAVQSMAGVAAEMMTDRPFSEHSRACCDDDRAGARQCIGKILRCSEVSVATDAKMAAECISAASQTLCECHGSHLRLTEALLASGRLERDQIKALVGDAADIRDARTAWERERRGEALIQRLREITSG